MHLLSLPLLPHFVTLLSCFPSRFSFHFSKLHTSDADFHRQLANQYGPHVTAHILSASQCDNPNSDSTANFSAPHSRSPFRGSPRGSPAGSDACPSEDQRGYASTARVTILIDSRTFLPNPSYHHYLGE
jgi:hypothetical protein